MTFPARGRQRRRSLRGLATHDPRVKIAGVVLNRVGSERHRKLADEAIEALGLPVFGALPRENGVLLPERHLGLVQAGETQGLDARLDALADFVEAHVDVEAIVSVAGTSPLRGEVVGRSPTGGGESVTPPRIASQCDPPHQGEG